MENTSSVLRITHQLNISPNEADFAIVSTDSRGTPGTLNRYVLDELGYSFKDFPNPKMLSLGYSSVSNPTQSKKPVLFVVTVGVGPTETLLRRNLFAALQGFRKELNGKRVWLPLMGSGDGGLSLEESYLITKEVLDGVANALLFSGEIIVSIPDSGEGKKLYDLITKEPFEKSTNSSRPLPHSKEEYIQRFGHIAQQNTFYFERSREILDQLRNFDQTNSFANQEEAKQILIDEESDIKSFIQLKQIWEGSGKDIQLTDFQMHLKKVAPHLINLFELILTFWAHVSERAFRKKELNPDLTAIADTGQARVDHMFSQFLEYATNHFSTPFSSRNTLLEKVIDYLKNPREYLNVVSEDHQKKISIYFLGKAFSGIEFHQKMISWFAQYEFEVLNEENRTFFYVGILYDPRVKPLWNNNVIDGVPPSVEELKQEPEDPGVENNREKIPFHLDQVVKEDKLGRKPIAKAFARLIKTDVFTKELNHSFMVHLQGEWGSGKSSFMNFMEEELNKGETKWVVINYNAWQNQHIRPPWWTLIDQVYRQAKPELNWWDDRPKLWCSEHLRRIIWYSGWQKFLSLLFTLAFVILLIKFANPMLNYATDSLTNEHVDNQVKGITLQVFAQLIISLASLIGVIFSLSKFISEPLFMSNSDEARSFLVRSKDPMTRIKEHFSHLVDRIISPEERELLIFIDDIDRCNREYIVELLEGIQTLFKEKRVLYIVAGDKQWITKSFANMYNEFGVKKEGVDDRLGELFIEKAFQLSFRMPKVSESAKEQFWNHIIGNKKQEEKISFEELGTEKQQEVRKVISNASEDITSSNFMERMEQDFNLKSDDVSDLIIEEKIRDQEEFKHLLNDFHTYINTNPRAIIRLANNYSMIRSTLIAERKNIPVRHLFRWLVIDDLLPILRTQNHLLSKIEELVQSIEKNAPNDLVRENCLKLLLGKSEGFDGALSIEEIHNIMGI